MKGKIDSSGWLMIVRGKFYESMLCPFTQGFKDHNYENRRCGGWCPHFSEPYPGSLEGSWWINICHQKHLYFTEFEDERYANDKS